MLAVGSDFPARSRGRTPLFEKQKPRSIYQLPTQNKLTAK
jgi:hypothetical protein